MPDRLSLDAEETAKATDTKSEPEQAEHYACGHLGAFAECHAHPLPDPLADQADDKGLERDRDQRRYDGHAQDTEGKTHRQFIDADRERDADQRQPARSSSGSSSVATVGLPH